MSGMNRVGYVELMVERINGSLLSPKRKCGQRVAGLLDKRMNG